jgi:hypothetical protein
MALAGHLRDLCQKIDTSGKSPPHWNRRKIEKTPAPELSDAGFFVAWRGNLSAAAFSRSLGRQY